MRYVFFLAVICALCWLLLPGCKSKALMDDMQPGDCDTTALSFAADIQPILQSYCTGCHNNAVANANINLANFEGVSVVIDNGRLLGSIRQLPGFAPMPQAGNPIPDCDQWRIEAWINQGALNN
jgi:hypothetical protein